MMITRQQHLNLRIHSLPISFDFLPLRFLLPIPLLKHLRPTPINQNHIPLLYPSTSYYLINRFLYPQILLLYLSLQLCSFLVSCHFALLDWVKLISLGYFFRWDIRVNITTKYFYFIFVWWSIPQIVHQLFHILFLLLIWCLSGCQVQGDQKVVRRFNCEHLMLATVIIFLVILIVFQYIVHFDYLEFIMILKSLFP